MQLIKKEKKLKSKQEELQKGNQKLFLEALNLKVVRYWNHEVLQNMDVVLEDLCNICLKLKDD